MKTTGMSLIILLIIGFGLSGCATSMAKQITSMNVGCETKDVEILNETVELNGTETWTAICDGKTYFCTYLPESSSDCYEILE